MSAFFLMVVHAAWVPASHANLEAAGFGAVRGGAGRGPDRSMLCSDTGSALCSNTPRNPLLTVQSLLASSLIIS